MSILNNIHQLIQEDLVAFGDTSPLGEETDIYKASLDDEVALRRLIISKMIDNNAIGMKRTQHLDGSITEKKLRSESIKDNLAKLLDKEKMQDMYNSNISYDFIDDFGGFTQNRPYGKIYNY